MLTVRQLNKQIDRRVILEEIDFSVDVGEVVAIVGRNGVGKTTLLRTMVGIIRPDSGDVIYGETSIFNDPTLKQQIIFVPDSADALKHYRVEEAAAFYDSVYPTFRIDRFREFLTRYNIENKKIKQLSKGQKALVTLALAFSVRARYYLLDEPTDGLDVIARADVLKFMIEQVETSECSIIVSSHQLHELERIADRIIMLENGRIKSVMSLEEARETSVKLQIVFNDFVPDEFLTADDIRVVSVSGRIVVVMAKRTEALDAFIRRFDTMLVEEIAMSLEDVFKLQLGGDHDDV